MQQAAIYARGTPPGRGRGGFRSSASLPLFSRRPANRVRIGLLVPFSGADAIWGPSCQCSAVLAAAEANETGGILNREVELFAVDAGGDPELVVDRTRELIRSEGLDAMIGVHLSSVRLALRREFGGHVPYVFAPLYEGGESTKGVFAIGETPEQQFPDAINYMIRERGARRWFLVGNDYVWPRASHEVVRRIIRDAGAQVVADHYLPLGQNAHRGVLAEIEEMKPDIVFQSLVGSDSVAFNRSFARNGLSSRILRLSGAIEENTLLGIGADATRNLFCAASYFNALPTNANRAFLERYRLAFGEIAPVQGVLSQSCYEAIRFFKTLAGRAGNLDPSALTDAWDGLEYQGARGSAFAQGQAVHVDLHLAEADGMRFRIVRSFPRSHSIRVNNQ